MDILIDIYEYVKQFLISNKDWIGDFIAILVFIISSIGGIFRFMYDKIQLTPNVKEARNIIENKNRDRKLQIEQEPSFFDEPNKEPYFLYKKIPIMQKNKFVYLRELRRKSYLLTGDAGCGKSALLKHDFIFNFNKKNLRKKSALIFLNAADLIELFHCEKTKKDLITNIIKSKYKCLILYLDGVDEIGEQNCEHLYNFINDISGLTRKTVLKVTCRTEFSHKHIERNINFTRIQQRVNIAKWSTNSLQAFAKKLLKHLSKSHYESNNDIDSVYEHILNKNSWEKHITTPLMMKLYIYLELHMGDTSQIHAENKYVFYEQFLTTLIKTYYRRENNLISDEDLEKLQNNISLEVFNAFITEKKDINIHNPNYIIPILKKVSSNKTLFTHETFFEYYIAKYYFTNLRSKEINIKMISILCQNYSNDFADFITDAIKTSDINLKINIFNKLRRIYCYTLEDDVQQAYRIKDKTLAVTDPSIFETLGPEQFFSLKYEIIFRLGRLGLDHQDVISFLDYIYYNDCNTKQSKHSDYYIAVLKRCCAISSSFLSSEKIEIDYVSHMLPFINEQYDKNYDLANRSHTLLFYGDVNNKNIFNFYDNDSLISCEKAFKKRILRLSYPLTQNISDMNSKDKRKFFFRLFDLATIYTFMYNRQKKLTTDELKIVSNCLVNFNGASQERNALMTQIKEEILKLNSELKNRKH